MYEQPLHTQCNSSTSGFNATCDLQGYSSRNTLTQYYLSWWLGHEITLTAQQNTIGHKKGFPKRPSYFFTKRLKKLDNQLTSRGLILTRAKAWDKVFIPKGWSAQRNQRTGCPYPRKWWDTLVSPLCKDSPMWIVLSHHWLCKNRGEWSSQTWLMITPNWQFSWKHKAVKYLWDTVTNPRVKCQELVITT